MPTFQVINFCAVLSLLGELGGSFGATLGVILNSQPVILQKCDIYKWRSKIYGNCCENEFSPPLLSILYMNLILNTCSWSCGRSARPPSLSYPHHSAPWPVIAAVLKPESGVQKLFSRTDLVFCFREFKVVQRWIGKRFSWWGNLVQGRQVWGELIY